MAARKKNRTSARAKSQRKKISIGKPRRPKKGASKKVSARKKAPARKKATRKTAPLRARTAGAKAKPSPSLKKKVQTIPAPTVSVRTSAEAKVGVITHYFNHLSVAIVKLEHGLLHTGDTVHVKGHTTDFSQRIDSLEIDHQPVTEAGRADDFGLKVIAPVRVGDAVYKLEQQNAIRSEK
jgi:putative protease